MFITVTKENDFMIARDKDFEGYFKFTFLETIVKNKDRQNFIITEVLTLFEDKVKMRYYLKITLSETIVKNIIFIVSSIIVEINVNSAFKSVEITFSKIKQINLKLKIL